MYAASRRELLKQAAIISAYSAVTAQVAPSHAGALVETAELSQQQWFDEWYQQNDAAGGGTKPPLGALLLYRFADEIYGLKQPIGWVPPQQRRSDLQHVEVPYGFVTDFASVPRIFWSLLPRDGQYVYPAIIHDYLYWIQDRPREVADEIFRVGMEEFGVGSLTVNAVYWSVRAAGRAAWDGNLKLRAQGEKRVLRNFPNNPLDRWENWKKQPSNFQ